METDLMEYAKAGMFFLEFAAVDLACLGFLCKINKAYEKRKFGKPRLFVLNRNGKSAQSR